MNLSGQTLGKYQLEERLGQGAMAQVYRAVQPTIERPVAIKLLHGHLAESAEFRERFMREARSMGQLQHPNIVQVIDFDSDADHTYMVMEFIEGDTLQAYIQSKGKLEPAEALNLTEKLAQTIAFAHEQGAIHRDIKPSNIMLRNNNPKQMVLMDFGIVRMLGEAQKTQTGTLIGSPAYMSPEAAHGNVADERTDVYSLGVVLYEMVTGQLPFGGDTLTAVLVAQATQPVPPPHSINPDLPLVLNGLLLKALAKDPNDRYQSAAAFVEAIDQVKGLLGVTPLESIVSTQINPELLTAMGGQSPLVTAQPAKTQDKNSASKLPLLIAAAVALLVLIGGVVWATGRNEQPATVDEASPTVAVAVVPDEPTEEVAAPTATVAPAVAATATQVPTVVQEAAAVVTDVPATPEPTETVALLAEPVAFGNLAIADENADGQVSVVVWLRRLPLPPAGAIYQLALTGRDDTVQIFDPIELSHLGTALLEYQVEAAFAEQLFLAEILLSDADGQRPVAQLTGTLAEGGAAVIELLNSAEFSTANPDLTEPDVITTADGQVGVFRIVSSADVAPTNYQFEATQLPPLTAEQQYSLWLTDPNFGSELFLNRLELRSGNAFASGQQAVNLLDYSRVVVSIEPVAAGNDRITGEIAFIGDLKAQSDARAIFDQIALPPFTSITFLNEQFAVAQLHYELSLEAVANDDHLNLRRHIEHVVNILDGEEGELFGDIDDDGSVQNPGNGDGVRGYLDFIITQLELFENVDELSGNQQYYVRRLNQMTTNALALNQLLLESGVRIQVTDRVVEAEPILELMREQFASVVDGVDVDRNGVIDAARGEGGTREVLNFALGVIEFPVIEQSQFSTAIEPTNSAQIRTLPVAKEGVRASQFEIVPSYQCDLP